MEKNNSINCLIAFVYKTVQYPKELLTLSSIKVKFNLVYSSLANSKQI